MVRTEVLRRRLHKLDEYMSILRNLRRTPWEVFHRDPEKYGSAERFLHLSIEAINDMGSHVVADLNLGPVVFARDVPEHLHEAGYLDDDLYERWLQMIGFRNVLVHNYLDIDHRLVYEVLQQHLDDFERLRQVFAAFL